MNFLLHRALCGAELGSEAAGVGAMLPDLWRMAHRAVRARRAVEIGGEPGRELCRGVAHHLECDLWFHACRVFREGERETGQALGTVGAPRLRLFAHLTWELCLDGAWLRRQDVELLLAELARWFRPTAAPLVDVAGAHGAGALSPAEQRLFRERMTRIGEALAAGPWLRGYLHGEGVAERLEGVRRRHFGMPPFTPAERRLLAAALDARLDAAAARIDELFADRARVATSGAWGDRVDAIE